MLGGIEYDYEIGATSREARTCNSSETGSMTYVLTRFAHDSHMNLCVVGEKMKTP
jgi:hypothetical protein